MLSLDKARAGSNGCLLTWADLAAAATDLAAVMLPECEQGGLPAALGQLRDAFGDRAYVAMTAGSKAAIPRA